MSDADPSQDRLSRELAELKPEIEQRAERIDANRHREAEDRSWIARRIINIFVGAIGAVLFLTSQAADVIKTAVLPVVTLVLGFYFGSRVSGRGL